jgi:4-amino-4-deoxy-L-arabinose transferase-like glycosyltransferase
MQYASHPNSHDLAPIRLLLILALLYLVCTSWNISVQQINKPDEPRYACPARAQTDAVWLVPYYNGEPRYRKPPLFYWTLAAAARAAMTLGFSLVTIFRDVSVVCGLITVLATFGIGQKLYSPRIGFIAALMLLGTFYFHDLTRKIIIDPQLTCILTLSWYFFSVLVSNRLSSRPTSHFVRAGPYISLGTAA